jgi:predicted oxidoreductase (fatty acid repression mutant protein)
MARVWDAASGNCVDEIKVHTARVRTAAFSPSGELIVTASDDTTAQVWDLTMRTRIAELKGHTDSVVSASFSPDGTRIVTASSDGTSRVWDAATGKQLAELRGHTDGLASASFSPNGSRIVTASSDMTARVWDSTTGTSLFELKGHTRFLNTASYNFDGTRIVTASVDGTARLWDAATGTGIAELKGHKLAVTSASFNPDGARIVTASLDATARVWDVATGTSLAVIRGHMHSVNSASFSSDGTRIVTAGADKTARVWDSVPYRVRYREILRARAAKTEPIVERRLKAGESAESLLAAFANDPALTPEERTAAQAALFARMAEQQANAQDRLIEADKLNTTAWDAVRFAPVTPETAAKALAAARRVIELAPDQGFYFNTLGVALYRASEFKEALDTLTRSDAINAKGEDGPLPGDIAFIAMSHWQLGHKDEARTSLATLRDLAAKERWKDDEETIRHLAEAEALIAEKP